MTRLLGVVAGLTLASAVAANSAQAQAMDDTRPVTIGIAGGLALPLGTFGDAVNSGYAVQGSVGFRPSVVPFGLRADVTYQSFDFDGFDASGSILSGTLNGLIELATTSGVRPYLIAGVGAYNLGGDFNGDTELGVNGGAGLRFALSGFNTFLEARYHSIFTENNNTNVIPILFGIEF